MCAFRTPYMYETGKITILLINAGRPEPGFALASSDVAALDASVRLCDCAGVESGVVIYANGSPHSWFRLTSTHPNTFPPQVPLPVVKRAEWPTLV